MSFFIFASYNIFHWIHLLRRISVVLSDVTYRRFSRFLLCDAMHKRGYCRHAVSVCLSVCHIRELCQNE